MSQQPFKDTITSLGRIILTAGNKPVLLNQPNSVWYIVKGHVDVFSVNLENEQPVGSRLYFFSCGQGELLFGIRSADVGYERNLMAVSSPDTQIIQIDQDALKKLLLHPDYFDTINQLIDTWVRHLSRGISKDISPRTDQLLDAGPDLNLETNVKFRSRKGILWIEFLNGNALFLGMKEILDKGEAGIFPVSEDSWMETIESSKVRRLTTAEICLRDDFWKQLDTFYQIIFFCELLNTRLNAVDEFIRLNEKARYTSKVRSAALLKIASVINDNLRKSYVDSGEDQLLCACKIVADYLGFQVIAPNRPKSDELTPFTLNEIVRASRFRTRKVKLQGRWWNKDNGAMLAFTREENSPVAIIPLSPGKYEYISPGKPKQRLTEEKALALASEAYQFYRPLPDHAVNGYHLIRFGLKSCARDILFILGAGLMGGLLTLLLPVLTGSIFDEVIPRSDHHQLYIYSMIIFVSAVAIAFFQMVRSFTMIRIETKLDFLLQSALWDRLLNLPVSFFKNYQSGELAAKANSIMMLRKILSDTVIYSILGAVFMLVNFLLLFVYDVHLALYTGVLLIASILIILVVGKKIQKKQKKIIHLQNKIFGGLIQFLSSISKIRIAGTEVQVFSKWASEFAENKRQSYEVRKHFLWVTLFSTALPLLITLFVFAAISGQLPNTLSTGQFLAFYTALTLAVLAFLQLGMAGINFFMAVPLLDNIRPVLEALPENSTLKAEIQHLTGEIEIDHVNFRYQPDGPLVLNNVSIYIKPGECIAIVGPSGSGKSTLLRLLLGFETPESGSVYYDRQDLNSYDPASIRRQAGTVLQHSQLSAGTIVSNIIGMNDLSFEEAWEAACNVGLDEDIKQMPMGMYTVITGGLSTLSEGQRQRIMVARAIASKPRILFFDEATSALDNNTQKIVSDYLGKMQATRIIIAHRLTTFQNADRIYLLDKGEIEESGTYTELINKGGKFAELVNRQLIGNESTI